MLRSLRNQGLAVFACTTLSLAACGEGDGHREGAQTSTGAPVDGATAQLALRELSSNVDSTVTLFGSNGPREGAAPAAGAALSFPCTAGGAADVGGYVNVAPSPVTVDVRVMIAYSGCVTGSGTMIAGDVDFSQTVVASPGAPLRIETLYQGDIAFSGNVNARCPIDLNVLVDETGAAVQVGGTFCGQDASTLDLRISPRWSSAP